ncbi:carbohydrate kinase [Lichenihabitans sp. Uapishka_5]|uniref:carbohydrate kinase family protein n=1 Tax=Lichenihabitans sp. Uapishka_5 TaxID=3037302 RepID=UPI0029E80109|nr:carbohydrate kinase [Lichenihabitans sp. Uapishka_5]MDX7950942.1 carbohydrate kinase [Lichenihabitans sp. Uapishka_5]
MPASEGLILVTGESLVDLIPVEATTFEAVLGGSPFNTAIGLGRLGVPTGFAGRISTDAMGELLVERLAADAVDLSFVARAPQPSPLAFVTRGTAATGARYAFYLGSTAYDGPSPLPAQWPDGVAHLHIGSFAAVDGALGEAALVSLRGAAGHGTTSFDPNIRPFVVPPVDRTRALVEERVRLSTIVKASDEDMDWLYPERDPHASASAWVQWGPRLVVLTRGGAGSTAFFDGRQVEVKAPTITVADTVGAGDSFMAALLGAMHRDGGLGPRANLGSTALTEVRVGAWLRFATAAAAITCTRKGANPPTRPEVEAGLA